MISKLKPEGGAGGGQVTGIGKKSVQQNEPHRLKGAESGPLLGGGIGIGIV